MFKIVNKNQSHRKNSESYAFSIESVAGTGWTEQLPNGSLVGMGSQLLRGEADVMISVNEFRPYRAEKLALGIVIYRTRFVLVLLVSRSNLKSIIIYGKDDAQGPRILQEVHNSPGKSVFHAVPPRLLAHGSYSLWGAYDCVCDVSGRSGKIF